MNTRLKRETVKLKKSWMQYEPAMLRDYLVEEGEDPRLNVQSVLSRHFLIETLFGNRFASMQEEELRFAVAMNWLQKLKGIHSDDARTLLRALARGGDNAGGIEIPHFISRIFSSLPVTVGGSRAPNYIEQALRAVQRD